MQYHFILKYLFFFLTVASAAQNNNEKIIDSLSKRGYQELKEIIFQEEVDSSSIQSYLDAYIKKAKKNNDSVEICSAYYSKIIHSKDKKENLKLYDSIITLSLNLKNKNYPTIAYYDLGSHSFNKRQFRKALDYYLLAKKYNKGSNKLYLRYLVNQSIANLKSRIDYDDEALTIYRNNLKYAEKKSFSISNKEPYFSLLFSLAHSLRKTNQLDSALYYNSKVLKLASESKYKSTYYMTVLNDGVINYYKKNYNKSYDSIVKGLNYITSIADKPNIAVGNFYLGKLHLEFNEPNEAIENFKKVDTIFQLNNDILPECRESYTHLLNYYREKKDLKNELLYVERLMKVDSVLTDNYRFLSKKINHDYDKQNLIAEKEKIITSINNKKKNYRYTIIGVTIIALTLILCLVYFIRKNAEKKIRLDALLSETEPKEEKVILTKEKVLNIGKEVVHDIELKLKCFELNNHFTNSNLSIYSLANDFKTNTNYLSKIINHLKGKKFSNYINELRIEYALDKLKNDPNFKKYTIQAIAQEVGFNTAQSFSSAFYKNTGVRVSYFIKHV